MPRAFVLIHSPLVGPTTWSLVEEGLRRRGLDALTPSLTIPPCDDSPYWERHAAAVTAALRDLSSDQAVVLVAHSGAGPLLPAIGHAVAQPVAAYVFVDAATPGRDGQSRLDQFDVEEAGEFRRSAANGMIPAVWRNDALLQSMGIKDAELRRRFAAEVPDVPLALYEEPLPVAPDWPDAPCGCVCFSAPYEADAQAARTRGWAVRELPGGHFHMLVDPQAVTDALVDVVSEIRA